MATSYFIQIFGLDHYLGAVVADPAAAVGAIPAEGLIAAPGDALDANTAYTERIMATDLTVAEAASSLRLNGEISAEHELAACQITFVTGSGE